MWSQTFKDSVVNLVNRPAPWVEWGQAFLFVAYGVVILATGGDWLQGELYQGDDYDSAVMALGALLLGIGVIHAYGIFKEIFFIRSGIARGATLFWLTLLVYYYYSPTHKIGTVMCLLWMLFNLKVYLWVAELKRHAARGTKSRPDFWFSFKCSGDGASPSRYLAVVGGSRRTEIQRGRTGQGGARRTVEVRLASTRGLPTASRR